jgi:DNA-binding LytR/AlgR family response regulator
LIDVISAQNDIVLTCVAVDDEPFALRLISDDIGKVPFLKLKKGFTSPSEALVFIQQEKIDLLFLDVQMPGLKGTEFLRKLSNPPMVIFTTAYEQYALEGFELNVIDYLVKPIPFDRFLRAASKALDLYSLKNSRHAPGPEGFLIVHAEYKEIKIAFNDILYIEGLKDYIKIYLKSRSRPVLTRMNLKAVEGKLPSDSFCRVHNSFIVALTKISATQKATVYLGATEIPIGEKFAEEFRSRYLKR